VPGEQARRRTRAGGACRCPAGVASNARQRGARRRHGMVRRPRPGAPRRQRRAGHLQRLDQAVADVVSGLPSTASPQAPRHPACRTSAEAAGRGRVHVGGHAAEVPGRPVHSGSGAAGTNPHQRTPSPLADHHPPVLTQRLPPSIDLYRLPAEAQNDTHLPPEV
jgi:hypothetical protein